MFERESEMTASAERWMRARGLRVKAEFNTPWGVCDLVGLKFNRQNVAKRVRLRQMRAIGSITRAALLLQLPDVESRRSVTLKGLAHRWHSSIPADVLAVEAERLIADRFALRSARGGLQKVNGWVPLQERIVAVELKLARIDEAMQQARSNLRFADESYVAFPTRVAEALIANRHRWSDHLDAGIGVLGVSAHRCVLLLPSKREAGMVDEAVQLYCVEKFWRTRLKDSST